MDELLIIRNMEHNKEIVSEMQQKLHDPAFNTISAWRKLKLKKIKEEKLIKKVVDWFCNDQNVPNNYEIIKFGIDWLYGDYEKVALERWNISSEEHRACIYSILFENILSFGTTAFILNIKELPQFKNILFVKNMCFNLKRYLLVNIILHELKHTVQEGFFDDLELKILEKHERKDLLNWGWSKELEAYTYAFNNTIRCLKDIL